MRRFLYQVPFSEYKPGIIDFISSERRTRIMVRNKFIHAYYGEILSFYRRLNAWYDGYASRMKEIVEVEKINLENMAELLRLELYLFNITEMYQDPTILAEGISFEKYMTEWVHKIDMDTIRAYFSTIEQWDGSSDQEIFSSLLLGKVESDRQVWLIDGRSRGDSYKM